ncbi:MAG: Lrp/AsnC family transcriptional regulator [Candidatus Diapherotrites archaeon]|nr:Lrp/AsnC family transcriptional regulator [Candidatus Diapherotrites archaeon]
MPTGMRFDDDVRIKILEALLSKNAVAPNLSEIKRLTGFHKATIVSSIDFLKAQGMLEGFGPKFNFRKMGYNLETMEIVQADLSKKDVFAKLQAMAQKDPHIYRVSPIIGSGTWNLMLRHIYKDVESYHHNMQRYYEQIPGMYDLIKDKQIIYATEPHYKNVSRTKSIVQLVKLKRGLE